MIEFPNTLEFIEIFPFAKTGEYYKVYPGVNCHNPQDLLKARPDLGTVGECNDTCDETPGCAAYGFNNKDFVHGCFLKKENCLNGITEDPNDILFVKPRCVFRFSSRGLHNHMCLCIQQFA